jgi:hypothetical protein
MRDQDLEQLARRLGERAARGVDPDRVAGRVVARLARGEQVRGPMRLGRWGLAVAAALTVAVLTQFEDTTVPGLSVAATPVAVSELDVDGLTEVLDSLAFDAPPSEYVGFGLGTMTTDELQALLAAMEG